MSSILRCSFLTNPGKGCSRCVETALVESGVDRGDVNYINAHAASIPALDFAEYQSIIQSFGQNSEVVIL